MERHQSVATETVPPARLITDIDTADGTTATAITTAVNAAETRAAEDWIKMRTSKVTVLPYDAAWADDFEKIKSEILGALDDLAEDAEKGRYNPFLSSYGFTLDESEKLTLECLLRDESDSAAAMFDLAEANESSRAYRIIKNILTEGMPRVANAVLEGKYRKPRREDIIKTTPTEGSFE